MFSFLSNSINWNGSNCWVWIHLQMGEEGQFGWGNYEPCNFGVPIFWQTHVAARNWFAVHPSWLILPSNQVPCISSLPRLRLGTWTNLNMHWQKQVFLIRGMVIFWKFMVLIPTGLTMIQLDSSHLNRFNFAFQAAKLPVAGFQSLDLGLHHGCQP